jgi:hypothetical protein
MCVVLIVMKINETCARSGLIQNDAIPQLRAFHAGEPSAAAYPCAITAALLPRLRRHQRLGHQLRLHISRTILFAPIDP